jgi:DNA-binding NarL/FixJ family response regulator
VCNGIRMTREQLAAVLGSQKVSGSDLDVLSDREVEVVSLLSQGANSSMLCRELQVTDDELRELKGSIREKCNLKDEVALIQFAARQGRR